MSCRQDLQCIKHNALQARFLYEKKCANLMMHNDTARFPENARFPVQKIASFSPFTNHSSKSSFFN